MTIRYAMFIDGAWMDVHTDSFSALLTVDEMGIEIKGYTNEPTDVVRLTFAEFAAIAEMVDRLRARQEVTP